MPAPGVFGIAGLGCVDADLPGRAGPAVVAADLEVTASEFVVDLGDVGADAGFVSDGYGVDAVQLVHLAAEFGFDVAAPACTEGVSELFEGAVVAVQRGVVEEQDVEVGMPPIAAPERRFDSSDGAQHAVSGLDGLIAGAGDHLAPRPLHCPPQGLQVVGGDVGQRESHEGAASTSGDVSLGQEVDLFGPGGPDLGGAGEARPHRAAGLDPGPRHPAVPIGQALEAGVLGCVVTSADELAAAGADPVALDPLAVDELRAE